MGSNRKGCTESTWAVSKSGWRGLRIRFRSNGMMAEGTSRPQASPGLQPPQGQLLCRRDRQRTVPVGGQLLHPYATNRDAGGVDLDGDKIGRQVLAGREVDKHLQRRKGKRPRSIEDGASPRVPPPRVAPGAFPRERVIFAVFPLGDSPDLAQAKIPCSMRPSSSSTSRMPASVSRSDTGVCPPSAGIASWNHPAACSSSSKTCKAWTASRARR